MDRHAVDTGSIPRCGKGFSPRVNFQCRLSYGVCIPSCAIAGTYICAYVKDSVVHVRARWIMETLKHPACTVGLVTQLCRSWLSWGRQPEFPMEEISLGQYSFFFVFFSSFKFMWLKELSSLSKTCFVQQIEKVETGTKNEGFCF